MIDAIKLKQIVEGALLAAGKPLPLERLENLFPETDRPEKAELEAALELITTECADRGFELKKVASGYRFQVRQEVSEWISRLWEEKPQRYSRALMETLSIIAYRQPITRGDIEKIRGVAVSTQIVQTLLEHEWVRVVGHRDVPGRPAMYATTKQFLDYFNLESLQQLPPLSEIRDLEEINRGLTLEDEKPVGRIIEFPDPEAGHEDLSVDEEEAAAAAIGTRPISEILSEVDNRLAQGLPVSNEDAVIDESEGPEVDNSGGIETDVSPEDIEPDSAEANLANEAVEADSAIGSEAANPDEAPENPGDSPPTDSR